MEVNRIDGGGGGGKGEIWLGSVDFSSLPEGCIANILSFTSPVDACRLSLVSSSFRSAANSDVVWDHFLSSASEYRSLLSSSHPSSLSSKKDLYFHLCDNPILIDGGTKSFSLDKQCGKNCYMLSGRHLFIVWGDTPLYWRWTSSPGARFAEVAELISVCWLEIRGKINTSILSPATLYAAYLVFKPTAEAYGFQYQPVEVAFGLVGSETCKRTVYLDSETGLLQRLQMRRPRRMGIFRRIHGQVLGPQNSMPGERKEGQFPKERRDGWLEIELGEFFNEGEDGELEMSILEVKCGNWKGGLIIQGIDVRPKVGGN